jgi:hypothetical protein
MLERLKQLFAPKRRGPDVEIEAQRPMGEGPAAAPVAPPSSGVPPAAPLGDVRSDETEQDRTR